MPATAEAANASKKTYTNWEAFAKAGLIPATLRCQSYKPVHLSDSSCHSNLKFDAATLKRHFDGEHGGGFWVDVRKTEGKPHPLWAELAASGLEAHDLRCDICDAQIRWSPNSIMAHMKAHSGKTRRVYPGGKFNFTIGYGQPDREDSDVEDAA
jgi:hypothetical protein